MSRILIVEDNEDHAMLAQFSLSNAEEKYQVDLAKSADECLQMIQCNKYDAVVLDYSLPKKNGLEILQDIRGNSYSFPIIMITSHGDEKVATAAMKNGAYDYVSKFDNYLDKLPLVIKNAIKSYEMEKERAELNTKVQESELRLRNIFDNVEAGFIEIDKDCNVSYMNPKAQKYMGDIDYESDQICKIFSEKKDCAECYLNQDAMMNNPTNCEIDYNNKHFSVSITPLLKDNISVEKILLVIIDITNQKKLQQQIIQSERMNTLGRLSSGVAHKFNNILAIIMGSAELMLMDAELNLESARKNLDVIQEASMDASAAVRRLQEFTRIAKQKEFSKLFINEVVEEALLMTEPRWKDQNQYYGINIDVSKDFNSQSAIFGNALDLKEALTNIIFNAIEAMPDGGQLKFETYEKDNKVCIAISDNGIGIREESISNIFEPFFTTKTGYAGLGLNIVHGIINRHEGNLEVESIYGEGSKFSIILPKYIESIESIDSDSENNQIQTKVTKSKILVIEDEKKVRELLRNVLVALDQHVDIAGDGFDGIKLLHSGDYDIVMTDLGMPGLSGWEVIQETKTINPNIVTVMITGWRVELDNTELKDKKVDFIISKPFHIKQIEDTILKAMILKNKRSKG